MELVSGGKVGELDFPSSIRTPGRTWTTYSDRIVEEFEETGFVDPEVEVEGDAEVKVNGEVDKDEFFRLLDTDENVLNYLHARYVNCLVVVEAERGESSVSLKYSSEGPVHSHVVVKTSQGSSLVITEETSSSGLNTSFTEIHVAENSTVDYGCLEKPSGFSYSRRKAVVDDYGTVNWLNSIFEGELNRTRIEAELEGDSSSTGMTGVWYPTGEQHHDISLQVRHTGEKTECDMDSRSVVDDRARSLYEGLQKVEREAEDTRSFQDQETLKLSDSSEADASPKLMIENPDVEASHAAAAGTVEKDKQHYLESRGLEEEEAEKLVVKGFFEPVMERIEVPGLKERVREEVRRKLEEKED